MPREGLGSPDSQVNKQCFQAGQHLQRVRADLINTIFMSLCETFACELGGTGKSCTCSYLTAVKLNVKGSVGKEKEGVAPEGTYCLLGKKTNSEDLTAGGPIKIPTATKGHKETGGKIPRTYSRLYHDSEASQRLNQCPDFHKICAPLSVPGPQVNQRELQALLPRRMKNEIKYRPLLQFS
nr:uncharacterized protein LOC105476891 isoform X1 [Macaca nemestrina]